MTQEQHKETLAKASNKVVSTNDEAFDDTSDARVKNNVMRHEYRTLTDAEKANMKTIKDIGLEFIKLCDDISSSRELSLAKTKMEEAVFWAVKHITK